MNKIYTFAEFGRREDNKARVLVNREKFYKESLGRSYKSPQYIEEKLGSELKDGEAAILASDSNKALYRHHRGIERYRKRIAEKNRKAKNTTVSKTSTTMGSVVTPKPSPSVPKPSPSVPKPSPSVPKPSPSVPKPSPNISKPSPSVSTMGSVSKGATPGRGGGKGLAIAGLAGAGLLATGLGIAAIRRHRKRKAEKRRM